MLQCDREILLIAPEIINPRSMPCVALGYIGAYLQRSGLRVRIIDAQFTKEDPVLALEAAAPTLVAITIDSRTLERGLALARVAKDFGHTVLMGGLHVSLIKKAMFDKPCVDYAITGDGEVATLQLVEALSGNRALSDVSGLIYRDDKGEVRHNPNITEVESLDLLPFPDYRLAGIDSFPLYPLVTSRDCPFKCIYCTVGAISHGRFRYRSAESCVQEIIAAKRRYGIRGFLVVDENFAANKKRALEFCRLLVEHKVNLPWSAFEGIRADSLDPNFLTLLRQAGCRWVFFGIETAENAVLKTIKKGSKFARVEKAVDLVRQYGLKVGGFLIVGLPDSNFEIDTQSANWAVSNLDRAQFWMTIPYYGTPLHDWVLLNGRLLRPPVGDNLVNTLSTMPFYETESYPAEEVKRAHAYASLRTGIDYFFEYLDRTAGSPLEIGYRRAPQYQKRLMDFTAKWCPELSVEVRSRLPEPNALAARMYEDIGDDADEPLPPDMRGGRSAPQAMSPVRVSLTEDLAS